MRLVAVLTAIALILGASACGEDGGTALEEALNSLGDGVSTTGTGYGWADADLLATAKDRTWAADALGPAADDLLDESARIARQTGLDPASATGVVSIGGSFAYGVRFDAADPGRLPELLSAAGATTRESGDWTLYDLGEQAHGEPEGPLFPFGALVSRVAIGPDGVVVARFDNARTSLIAEQGPLNALDTPSIALASDCLGDVAAARLVPGSFTHNRAIAPDLLAMGVDEPRDEPRRETLCAISDDPEVAQRHADELERTLAPGAVDEITGEPVSNEIAGASVTIESDGDQRAARVELEPAPGVPPGILFGAFVRGSMLTWLGAARPIPGDVSFEN